MRWLTVRVPGQPGHDILLEKPGPPAMDDATARQVRELISKGASGFAIGFTTKDCRKTYQTLLAKGVEFTQEPVEQPYGIDVGLRDVRQPHPDRATEGRRGAVEEGHGCRTASASIVKGVSLCAAAGVVVHQRAKKRLFPSFVSPTTCSASTMNSSSYTHEGLSSR